MDTSIWSLALRRAKEDTSSVRSELESLIADHRVVMIGPIRQELLSGIRSESQFDSLKKRLSAFPDEPIAAEDYEEAARIFNVCRQNGIQGSNTDFLICAVAKRQQFEIFTTDNDFTLFSESHCNHDLQDGKNRTSTRTLTRIGVDLMNYDFRGASYAQAVVQDRRAVFYIETIYSPTLDLEIGIMHCKKRSIPTFWIGGLYRDPTVERFYARYI